MLAHSIIINARKSISGNVSCKVDVSMYPKEFDSLTSYSYSSDINIRKTRAFLKVFFEDYYKTKIATIVLLTLLCLTVFIIVILMIFQRKRVSKLCIVISY